MPWPWRLPFAVCGPCRVLASRSHEVAEAEQQPPGFHLRLAAVNQKTTAARAPVAARPGAPAPSAAAAVASATHTAAAHCAFQVCLHLLRIPSASVSRRCRDQVLLRQDRTAPGFESRARACRSFQIWVLHSKRRPSSRPSHACAVAWRRPRRAFPRSPRRRAGQSREC